MKRKQECSKFGSNPDLITEEEHKHVRERGYVGHVGKQPTRKCDRCGKRSWVIIVSATGEDLCDRCTDAERLQRNIEKGTAEMICGKDTCERCTGAKECWYYQLIKPFK
jgi:hypothetical protein